MKSNWMVNFSNSYFHPIFSCYHLCGKVMFSNNNQRLQIHIFQLQIDSPSLFSCTPTKVSAMHNRCLNLPGLPPGSLIIQPSRRQHKLGHACVIYAPKHNVAFIHLSYLVPNTVRSSSKDRQKLSCQERPRTSKGHLCSFISTAC